MPLDKKVEYARGLLTRINDYNARQPLFTTEAIGYGALAEAMEKLSGLGLPGGNGASIGDNALATSKASSVKVAETSTPTRIVISSKKYPQAAQHIVDAQASGKPVILTIDRAGTAENRRAALRTFGTRPGKDRDEYPPASTREGGTGSSVRHIDSSDNRGAGACYGAQCSGLADGTRIIIVVD